jgi:alginate O-acetyltransferase complex protein AlgJ
MREAEGEIVHSRHGMAICLVCFLALIALPLPGALIWPSNEADIRSQEQREPSPLPPMPATADELAAWPRRFESWLADRLPLRTNLVLANTWVQLKIFRQSTSGDVVLGKDGWLFYAGTRSMEQALGQAQFTPIELDRWIDVMERRQAWLAERSIPFLAVVIPNKERVYREYLPDPPAPSPPISHLDQLRDRLAVRNSPLNLLDLTPWLMRVKGEMRAYAKSDTHWTGAAAFLAGYVPIMERLRAMGPDFKTRTLANVRCQFVERHGGDLAGMLGAPSLYREVHPECWPVPPLHMISNTHRLDDGLLTGAILSKLTHAPKVVWFSDSFSVKVLGYLHETFRESIVTQHGEMRFNRRLVEAEKPDFVVYQFVERSLTNTMPAE